VRNLPPSCAVVMISGSLNFLEPSGPVQACNGTALPFFVGSYYFMQLVVVMSILFVFSLVLMRGNAFW